MAYPKTLVSVTLRLEVTLEVIRRSNKEYSVRLLEGEWPADRYLIDFVDGANPLSPYHMPQNNGGEVKISNSEKERTVIVYS